MSIVWIVAGILIVMVLAVSTCVVLWVWASQSGAERNRPLPAVVKERLADIADKERSHGNQ